MIENLQQIKKIIYEKGEVQNWRRGIRSDNSKDQRSNFLSLRQHEAVLRDRG